MNWNDKCLKGEKPERDESVSEVVMSWAKRHEQYKDLLKDVEFWFPNNQGDFSFLRKLYEMVDDPSTDSIVSWSQSGKSFIVWNESEFTKDVLPRCLQYSEMKNFTHQLDNLGFKKGESEQWQYGCDYFVRGQPPQPQPQPKMTTERKRELENSMDQMLALRSLWRPKRCKSGLEITRSFIKRHQHIEGIDEIFNLKSLVGDPDGDDCSNDPAPPLRTGPSLLLELYKVVDDPSTDSTVSWSQSGNSVIIWNEYEFCKEHLLPRCSKFKDMSQYTGWLVSWGFRKVESSAPWEYACEYFVRGKPLFTPNKWLTGTPSSGLEPVPDYVRNFERNVETNLKRVLARRLRGSR
ncbi:unnamed protein product [Microthlaspi erraticum]|uniref:HSF-type DNA-binding domain-containing protein n=1 Tax=Microthlaspi erraticum TaxID=1685480 RepID=A0A6D2I899_9BRAS|nr:unnamed protein product [Microthlaspi erraticum]